MAGIHNFGSNNNNNNNNNSNNPAGVNITNMGSQVVTDDDMVLEILINYNELAAKNSFNPLLFRDAQMYQLFSILNTMNHPNALLIGDAGVGKTGIVEEFARLLASHDPIAESLFKGYTIYELPISKLVAGKSFVGQLEEALNNVITFASTPSNKAIIFIDEIHQLLSSNDSTGDKIAQILKPALGRKDIRFIGATTTQEASIIQRDPAFSRRWSTVKIPELTEEQTVEVIKALRPKLQQKHGVIISDETILKAIPIADEYKQYGSHRPDTTITLIDRAMSDSKIKDIRKKQLLKLSGQTNIPVSQTVVSEQQLTQSALSLISSTKNATLNAADDLAKNLDANIIGQKDAKDALVDSIRRQTLALRKNKRPKSFLLAGPSGTGKTEIVKQLTASLYGRESKMLYVNMTEYSHSSALTNITGSSLGYIGSTSKQELVFDSLETNPYQIILLDEFEKADPQVQQYFMQALDEGVTRTNRGKTIDFSRSIIIATTNAGVDDLNRKQVGFANQGLSLSQNASKTDITKALQTAFKPELINRFEHIISFKAMLKDDYAKLIGLKYNKIINEIKTNRPDLKLTPESVDLDNMDQYAELIDLVETSYDASLNGRPAERVVQAFIENTILANKSKFTIQLIN